MRTQQRQPRARGFFRRISGTRWRCAFVGLLLLLHPLARPAFAEAKYYWQTAWMRKDGLRGSQIWALAQDRLGYIWLGTNEGLVRFDGVRFVGPRELGLESLPTGSVRALLVARDGTLWIGFGGIGGISRISDGQVVNYRISDGLRGVVTSLIEDQKGAIWAASLVGVFCLRKGRWELSSVDGQTLNTNDGLFEDSRGNLWIGTVDGVFRRGAHEERLSLFSSRLNVHTFAEDATGTVWGTVSGTTVVKVEALQTAQPELVRPTSASGSRLLHDPNGGFWLATLGNGLLHLPGDGPGVVKQYKGGAALTSDVVRCVLQDREGNIWAGTQNGLNRLSESVVVPFPEPGDPMSRLVRAVAVGRDGAVWIGTGDGLYQLFAGGRRRLDQRDGLPGSSIAALHTDGDGELWLAVDRSVGRLSAGRFHSTAIPADVQLGRISGLTIDRHHDLWICDIDRGVVHLRNGQRVVTSDAGSADHSCFAIYTDSLGRVWAGFLDGTLKAYADGSVRSYAERDGLIGGMVSSIYEDRSHRIWIGSSNGLSELRGERFVGLGWNSGLPGNIVGAIGGDDRGNLWLGVSSGIVRVATTAVDQALTNRSQRLQYTLYDASDGLRGDPIGLQNPTVPMTPDGTLWFITSDGLALINSHVARTRLPPLVNVEQAVANDRAFAIAPQLRLPAQTRRLQINFTALSFTAPQKVRFSYRLEGYDRDWVDGGFSRQAVYTNLQPGRYRFLVTAMNEPVASESPAVWEFSIAPSFYQTRWFPFVLCTIAAMAVAGVWRLRVHQVNARFSAILGERARVAREIHDTLLQSLYGVALRLDNIAATVASSPTIAEHQLHVLRREVEFYVREARQSIRDLRSPVLETRDLAAALREAVDRVTSGEPVDCEFRVTGRARRADARTEENLLRIGQEAVGNAVRHGNATRVRVALAYDTDRVSLRVADDGEGFDTADPRTENHWGLTNIQERSEQIGAKFRLTTQPGAGTTIEIEANLPPRASMSPTV